MSKEEVIIDEHGGNIEDDQPLLQVHESSYQMALNYLRDEGKLKRGGSNTVITNMKMAIKRVAASNSYFRELDLQLPPSHTKI